MYNTLEFIIDSFMQQIRLLICHPQKRAQSTGTTKTEKKGVLLS